MFDNNRSVIRFVGGQWLFGCEPEAVATRQAVRAPVRMRNAEISQCDKCIPAVQCERCDAGTEFGGDR
jgi:hypothetical protein